jgi:hypothetical protein
MYRILERRILSDLKVPGGGSPQRLPPGPGAMAQVQFPNHVATVGQRVRVAYV